MLSFDICDHKYTQLCADYLTSHYDFSFIVGNSLNTIPSYPKPDKYDLIHIDGGHNEFIACCDLINCKQFSHKNSILVIDDAQHPHMQYLIKVFIKSNIIYEVDYNKMGLKPTLYHRIFRYYPW